jgi:Leucine-rich repeat (LRR) protein
LETIDDSLSRAHMLKTLDLSHNRIAVLANLHLCTSLQNLDLTGNQIASVVGVRLVLGNVQTLNISHNFIQVPTLRMYLPELGLGLLLFLMKIGVLSY